MPVFGGVVMEVEKREKLWFGTLFRRISLTLTNIGDHKMGILGITSSQYWLLKLLWEKDGVTQKDLASKLSVKPASLTGMVDNMVEKGWVRRVADPVDARVKRIFLTPAGKELETEALEIITKCEEVMCEGLSEEEKIVLKGMLTIVLENLRNEQKLL